MYQMTASGQRPYVSRHSSTTRRAGARTLLNQPVEPRGLRLPELPTDRAASRRQRSWAERLTLAGLTEQARNSIAIGLGGALGTTVGTLLCLAFAS
jgi:hypothetical protein